MAVGKLYVLHPGYITSSTDGERHFVSAKELAQLYGVCMCECYIRNDIGVLSSRKNLVHLYPLNNGQYERVLSSVLPLTAGQVDNGLENSQRESASLTDEAIAMMKELEERESKFSKFIREGSDEEKAEVYSKVLEESSEKQRASTLARTETKTPNIGKDK